MEYAKNCQWNQISHIILCFVDADCLFYILICSITVHTYYLHCALTDWDLPHNWSSVDLMLIPNLSIYMTLTLDNFLQYFCQHIHPLPLALASVLSFTANASKGPINNHTCSSPCQWFLFYNFRPRASDETLNQIIFRFHSFTGSHLHLPYMKIHDNLVSAKCASKMSDWVDVTG
jgi:hypothetical protein